MKQTKVIAIIQRTWEACLWLLSWLFVVGADSVSLAKSSPLISWLLLGVLIASVYAFFEFRYSKLRARLGKKQSVGSLEWELRMGAYSIAAIVLWALFLSGGRPDPMRLLQNLAFVRIFYFIVSHLGIRARER